MPTGRQLTIIFSRLSRAQNNLFELSETKLHRSEEKQKSLRVSEGSNYGESTAILRFSHGNCLFVCSSLRQKIVSLKFAVSIMAA